MPMSRRKTIKEDEIIAPSQNQLFVPKTAEIGASNASGLNQMVWRSFWSSVVGSFSHHVGFNLQLQARSVKVGA
jgi:hypothetical protein